VGIPRPAHELSDILLAWSAMAGPTENRHAPRKRSTHSPASHGPSACAEGDGFSGTPSRLSAGLLRTWASIWSRPFSNEVEHLVDFIRGDDERRAEGNRVLHVADDEAKLLHDVDACGAHALLRVEGWRLVFLSATSSMAPIRPTPRASPTSGCSASFISRDWKTGATFARMLHDLVALIDLDGLQRHGTAHRMGGIGIAMAEGAELAALVQHRLIEVFLDGDGRHREIGRGDGLSPW
jgi:hypothetical protein